MRGRRQSDWRSVHALLHLRVFIAVCGIGILLAPPVDAYVLNNLHRRTSAVRSYSCLGVRAWEKILTSSSAGRMNLCSPVPLHYLSTSQSPPRNAVLLATGSNGVGHSSKGHATGTAAGGAIELEGVFIPPGALRFSASRSSGPGGQNVNKVNSRAELRVHVGRAEGGVAHPQPHTSPPTVIDREVFEHLKVLAGSRISSQGDLIITSQEFRSLAMNRDACLSKLRSLLAEAVAASRRPLRQGAGSASLPPLPPPGVASLIRLARRRDKDMRGERKRDRQRVGVPAL